MKGKWYMQEHTTYGIAGNIGGAKILCIDGVIHWRLGTLVSTLDVTTHEWQFHHVTTAVDTLILFGGV